MFPQGSWQASAISTYFATVGNASLPPQNKAAWPPGGRATPDVSALGALSTNGKKKEHERKRGKK